MRRNFKKFKRFPRLNDMLIDICGDVLYGKDRLNEEKLILECDEFESMTSSSDAECSSECKGKRHRDYQKSAGKRENEQKEDLPLPKVSEIPKMKQLKLIQNVTKFRSQIQKKPEKPDSTPKKQKSYKISKTQTGKKYSLFGKIKRKKSTLKLGLGLGLGGGAIRLERSASTLFTAEDVSKCAKEKA
jgi:hypothetical protein